MEVLGPHSLDLSEYFSVKLFQKPFYFCLLWHCLGNKVLVLVYCCRVGGSVKSLISGGVNIASTDVSWNGFSSAGSISGAASRSWMFKSIFFCTGTGLEEAGMTALLGAVFTGVCLPELTGSGSKLSSGGDSVLSEIPGVFLVLWDCVVQGGVQKGVWADCGVWLGAGVFTTGPTLGVCGVASVLGVCGVGLGQGVGILCMTLWTGVDGCLLAWVSGFKLGFTPFFAPCTGGGAGRPALALWLLVTIT